MGKDTIIYDPTGQPLKKRKDNEDDSIPVGVQALIETRLNSAVDQIRERNQDKLEELSRNASMPWKAMSAFWFVITLIMWFYAPSRIEKQVAEKLTEPEIKSPQIRLLKGK